MMNFPQSAKLEMNKRVNELNNFEAVHREQHHGIINNHIFLNLNHNREFLWDALQIPLKAFNNQLRHPDRKISKVVCQSKVKHQMIQINSMHRKGVPNPAVYQEFDQLRHLFSVYQIASTCFLTSAEAGISYYLSGQLAKSIAKMFNQQDWNELTILRNGLARIYVNYK